jgi:sigma-B regulation protein RsbU (phosphoserine phosphatase)
MLACLKSAPIIVVSPSPTEARDIATWLRGASLRTITTVRTCDEAIFLLGRGRPDLLIIDDAICERAEQRLFQHVRSQNAGATPPLVRLTRADGRSTGRLTPVEVIRKPLSAHEVVLRVGAALQRPDLLGRLDESRDQAAQHLAAARRMQIALLPAAAQLELIHEQCGVGVAGFYRAGEDVGGDLWGIWPTHKGRFALAIADFVGNGLSAALNTFRLHALLSDQSLPRGLPTRMAALLNDRLQVLLPPGHYATMVYLLVDPARRRVTWCGAGAPPPLLVSADHTEELKVRGLPLGLRAGTQYRRASMRLPASGILVVFSDGLFESGSDDPEIPRGEITAALDEPVRLAASGHLVAAAERGTACLQALRDRYPSGSHSDDVMAICVAFGPAAR